MSASDADLVEEARRRVLNARDAHDGRRANLDKYLAAAIEQHAFDRMVNIFRHTGVDLLILGQARYVLERDPDGARATFGELREWMPFVEAARAGQVTQKDLLIEPAICLLLASDFESLASVAALGADAAVPNGTGDVKPLDARRVFWFDLCGLLSADREPDRSAGAHPLPPKLVFSGYERLLQAIASDDAAGFETYRSELEEAYPARRKRREDTLMWTGEGKLAQVATFDALGTALCRLAVRRGLDVELDTPLYPAAFFNPAQ